MKSKFYSLIAALLVFSSLLQAQLLDKVESDFKDFLKVGGDFFTRPLHFDSEDWTNFALTTATMGSGFLLDNTMRKYSQQDHTNFKDDLFDIDQYYTTSYAAILTAGIYGYGLIDKNDRVRNVAVQLGESVFYAGVITVTLKTIVGRSRPYTERGHTSFHPFSVADDRVSFPSGHCRDCLTLAFAFSTVMAHQVNNIFWKVGWFSAAGLVSYARMYHDQHWFSDVLIGGAIGYFTGRFVVNHPLNNKEEQLSESKNKPFYSFGINFIENQPVYSLNIRYQF